MSTHPAQTYPHTSPVEVESRAIFGFWIYIMSDCILFACLFATYAVLHRNTFGGPTGEELFSLPFVLLETMVLLTSSFTYGLAMLGAHRGRVRETLLALAITFMLGVAFLVFEFSEFMHLVEEGNSWQRNAFLSSFFTLLGTHGLHVFIGLLWMATVLIQLSMRGLTQTTFRKLTVLGLFWHFLDIVWIFIFTIVYLLGALGV